MKHNLRTALIAFLTLFPVSLASAQENFFNGLIDGFTMPMRIVGSKANTSVDIGIDTIRYVRNGNDGEVSLDAHATLQIPFAIVDGQESTKIKFRGENLTLVGDGPPAVLTLDADFPLITIQENKIDLRIDDASVRFTCEGVEAIKLQGAFLFNESFIKSAESGNRVEATFNVTVADWDDLMFEVKFTDAFKIEGCGDFVFKVEDAVVDFSTQSNVSGFSFPSGYDTGFLHGDENLWTGFALKQLVITPPQELEEIGVGKSDRTGANRDFTYTISNMLIDASGLTGSFLAERAAQSFENRNNGLNLSIDTIGVSIMQNYLVGGIIAGTANVPLLKKEGESDPLSIGIGGALQYDRAQRKITYHLSGTMLNDVTYGVPFTENASITLARGCSFTVGNDGEEGQFGATLLLNGMLNINGGDSSGGVGDKVSIQGIRFEGLRLSTFNPHFYWEYFGLEGSVDKNIGGFSISLTKLELRKETENEADLHIEVMLKLMESSMSIAVGTKLTISMEYNGNDRWEYDTTKLNALMLDVDFSAFRLKGSLAFYNGDAMYGNGFDGNIRLTLKPFNNSTVDAEIQFGNTNYNSGNPDRYYKYWFTKIRPDLPFRPLLFPPAVMLKSIKGGAYQRMNYPFDRSNLTGIATTQQPNYVPNKDTAFGFMAGIGVYFAQENLISANALLDIAFNSHFGLRYVRIEGFASILSDTPEEGKGLANASLQSYYDVENKIFSAELNAGVNFVNVLTGDASVSIYSSPDTWHCHIGTIYDPNRLNFIGLTDVRSYFMFGAIPSQLPPLSSKVLALFGTQASSNAVSYTDEILRGEGFAFGISLSATCGLNPKRGFVFAFVEMDGGTDMLVDFDPRNCPSDWRAKGQAYAYVNGEAGVRVRKKKFHILQISAAAVLSAEIPAPYYFSGRIAFKYKVLFLKGKIRASYYTGKSC